MVIAKSNQKPVWQVLAPERRVLWLDIDGVPGPEARAAEATTNATEAALAERIVAALADSGVPLISIGIISPYRSQVGTPSDQRLLPSIISFKGYSGDTCMQPLYGDFLIIVPLPNRGAHQSP